MGDGAKRTRSMNKVSIEVEKTYFPLATFVQRDKLGAKSENLGTVFQNLKIRLQLLSVV